MIPHIALHETESFGPQRFGEKIRAVHGVEGIGVAQHFHSQRCRETMVHGEILAIIEHRAEIVVEERRIKDCRRTVIRRAEFRAVAIPYVTVAVPEIHAEGRLPVQIRGETNEEIDRIDRPILFRVVIVIDEPIRRRAAR